MNLSSILARPVATGTPRIVAVVLVALVALSRVYLRAHHFTDVLGGAALLVFVDCLKELPVTLLMRPLNVETLSTYIYQFATRGNFEEGALAALLIVAAGIVPVIRMARYSDLALMPEAAPQS
jgi:iron(III) transport system permease protein